MGEEQEARQVAPQETPMAKPNPPWLHLVEPQWRAWRDDQILKGRDPDPYMEEKLIEAGVWKPPPRPTAH
jgi:hypothetical protein